MAEENTEEKKPEMKLTPTELEYFKEINGEMQQLGYVNSQLDLQKRQVVDELVKNAENGRKFVIKIARKFGLREQDLPRLDINLETGLITLKAGT
jgi:hypothetical protein